MADLEAEYRIILQNEFSKKKAKNSRYSMRAFAKFLNVDPSFLSKLLAGKVLLTLELAEQITVKLKLEKNIRDEFLLSVAEEQKCESLRKVDPSLTDCH